MTDFSLDKLVAAQTEAEGLGVVFPEALKGALREAADPHYKIGVMGRFQAGKTTLVNRVFLRQPLLKEGEGLCTTAVCTEVTYGPEAKLTLVKDGVTQTFSPPTAEAIVAATTASTEEERLALAESITQLRIETPNENLRRYTILDTPGLDDPNRALLDVTTYRELPQCDLVLLVADARQLSQIDFDFLCGDVLGQAQTACREVAQRHLAEVTELIEGMDDFLGESAETAKGAVDTAPRTSSVPHNIFDCDIWQALKEKLGGDPIDKALEWGSEALSTRLEGSPNAWVRLAGIAVRYLPTLLKPLRGKLAAQALDEQLAVFGDQLRGQIEAFVDRFHDWLDAAIDAQVEQAREQLKRTFEEALDDRPDDPAALAAEAETLEALAGRILA